MDTPATPRMRCVSRNETPIETPLTDDRHTSHEVCE